MVNTRRVPIGVVNIPTEIDARDAWRFWNKFLSRSDANIFVTHLEYARASLRSIYRQGLKKDQMRIWINFWPTRRGLRFFLGNRRSQVAFPKVFIGYFSAGLTGQQTKDAIKRLCPDVKKMAVSEKHGKDSINVLFCCASFQSVEDADKAIKKLSGLRFRGKRLEVREWNRRSITNDRRNFTEYFVPSNIDDRRVSDRRTYAFYIAPSN